MEPTIIKKDKLFITGLPGDGNQTGKVWEDFDSAYVAKPFPKAEEYGYEIRFYDSEKPARQGRDIHVGFLTNDTGSHEGFATMVLPAAMYAVFDIHVAEGYESGNAMMDKWLEDNALLYKQMPMDGVEYIIMVYNEKFDRPDSVVEIWIPIEKT